MKQILCFGDSNTWGLIAGTWERYSWSERWTGILQEKLSGWGIRVVEEGLCGRTTVFEDETREGRRGAAVFPLLLETHVPDLIIIMLGTNDCKAIYGATAEEIGQGIEVLLNQARTCAPSSRILLMSPIHLGYQVWKEEFDPAFNRNSVETSRKLKGVYERIAGKYGTEFLAASDYAEPSPVDREHLAVEGHRALADIVYRSVVRILISAESDLKNISKSRNLSGPAPAD